MKETLMIKGQISFQNYPLTALFPFKSESLSLQDLFEKNAPFASLANELASIRLLLIMDEIDLLVVDPMRYLEGFLTLEGKNIVIEEFTINEQTEQNVLK